MNSNIITLMKGPEEKEIKCNFLEIKGDKGIYHLLGVGVIIILVIGIFENWELISSFFHSLINSLNIKKDIGCQGKELMNVAQYREYLIKEIQRMAPGLPVDLYQDFELVEIEGLAMDFKKTSRRK